MTFDLSKNVWFGKEYLECDCDDCGIHLTEENAVTELTPVEEGMGWEAVGDYCIVCAKKRGYKEEEVGR